MSPIPVPVESEYNRGVDVLVIPEARREIEALRAFRPASGTWGILIGHRRGPRYIVEKVVAAGRPGLRPDERLLEAFDRIWPGGVIGLMAVRPDAAFKKAVLAPVWYGKLVLRSAGPERAPVLQAGVVEFERRFFLDAVPLAAAVKEKAHE